MSILQWINICFGRIETSTQERKEDNSKTMNIANHLTNLGIEPNFDRFLFFNYFFILFLIFIYLPFLQLYNPGKGSRRVRREVSARSTVRNCTWLCSHPSAQNHLYTGKVQYHRAWSLEPENKFYKIQFISEWKYWVLLSYWRKSNWCLAFICLMIWNQIIKK